MGQEEEECLRRKQRGSGCVESAGDPGELSYMSRKTLSSCSVMDKGSGKMVFCMKTFLVLSKRCINACLALITYCLDFSVELIYEQIRLVLRGYGCQQMCYAFRLSLSPKRQGAHSYT